MITAILADKFKGLSFTQPLGQYTLICGPNGKGKSARSQALAIAAMGYSPTDQKKRPGDILATHGVESEGEFSVGFQIEKNGIMQTFARKYKRTESGATHEAFCNKKKLTQAQIEKALFELGEPRVFDISSFMSLSDAKKIEYLFNLFPPDIDVADLEEKIQAAADNESALNAKLKGVIATIERLSSERAQLQQTSGTLAELQAEIAAKDKALQDAQEALREVEIKEREERIRRDTAEKARLAKEKADQEAAQQRAKNEELEKKVEAQQKELRLAASRTQEVPRLISETDHLVPPVEAPSKANIEVVFSDTGHFLQDLQTILRTLQEAGCKTCGAAIVVRSMITKYSRANGRKEAVNG